LNFEELDSPTPTSSPDQVHNCVDTGPAAKMLIPKADRKAIHEVRPISTFFIVGEQRWRKFFEWLGIAGGDGTCS
jgi:hypothetical protein